MAKNSVPFAVVYALSKLDQSMGSDLMKLIRKRCFDEGVTEEDILNLPPGPAHALWILIDAYMIDEEYIDSIHG